MWFHLMLKRTTTVSEEDKRIVEEATSLLHGNRDLAVLYDIAGYLNHQIDVHQALQEVLARVTELLDLQTGWVWLINEQNSPSLAASRNLPPYLSDHPERMSGSCLCMDTFLSGTMERPANVDVLRCSRLKNAERDCDPSALGLRFHASVPIYAGDTPLGVMNVASEDWRELRPDELQLLHIVSDQIGLAIQRARLSAQHTRAAARLATTEERNRLAREIHDTLAQGFAGILLHLEAANGLDGAVNVSECLAKARELAKCGLEDARRMLLGLRPKSLEGAHLCDALSQLAERFSRDCGINCTFGASGRPQELSEEIENELYRVAQEALCNVRKHSRAGSVSILLSYKSGGVMLAIKDNGQGFAINQRQTGAQGFGLPTMCERANRLGGKMDINTALGTGTEIRMSVPLSGKTSKERNNR